MCTRCKVRQEAGDESRIGIYEYNQDYNNHDYELVDRQKELATGLSAGPGIRLCKRMILPGGAKGEMKNILIMINEYLISILIMLLIS